MQRDAAGAALDRSQRVGRAREALARLGCAGLISTPGPNLLYLTRVSASPSERLLALVLPAVGELALIAPAFERERVSSEVGARVALETWEESDDPFALLAAALARASGAGVSGPAATWLLDPLAPFWVAAGCADRGARLRSAGPLCAALRRRKEPGELEMLTRAQRLTRDTLASVRRDLAPGVTEREVARRIEAAFRDAGAEGWALVQFGEGSALPHGEVGDRPLRSETAVLVDLGAVVEGYHADLTRSWWFGGRPPTRYAAALAAVEGAQSVAAALAGPGIPAQDLDRAARRYLGEAGLARFFVHRLGHGVGLEIHEAPFLVEGNGTTLESGDVVTIEPGAYLPGEFGVRHEDVWVVTEDGAQRL